MSGMTRKGLLWYFWNCGDDAIIQFAITRAHLNKREIDVLQLTLDELKTQDQIAEEMHYSTRRIQDFWKSGSAKILTIPWVYSYARDLMDNCSKPPK